MHETEVEDELRLMVHCTSSSVRTQKGPFRDPDILVLTVCGYRRRIKERKKSFFIFPGSIKSALLIMTEGRNRLLPCSS